MQISLTFKKMASSDFLKSHTQEKFDELDKMLDSTADTYIIFFGGEINQQHC